MAFLERPWKFDLTYKVGFTVLRQQDLNMESPLLRIPSQKEIAKSAFMGLFGNTEMKMSVTLPCTGFVAGQTLNVNAIIDNPTNVAIEEIKVSLKKKIRYNSQVPTLGTKEEEETVRSDRYPGVPKKDKRNILMHFQIPAVPPSSMNSCRIIEVKYEIKVKAEMGGVHRSADIYFPITIGTVPLTSTYGYQVHPIANITNENAAPTAPNSEELYDQQIASAPSAYSGVQDSLNDVRNMRDLR